MDAIKSILYPESRKEPKAEKPKAKPRAAKKPAGKSKPRKA